MLERLRGSFRELLKQFDGTVCPLCGVLARYERQQIESVHAKYARVPALCGTHLDISLSAITDSADRARRARQELEAWLAQGAACEVCMESARIESSLVRSIRRLDGSMRFRKALESAPLFCRRHADAVADASDAINFAEVQRAKARLLRDSLAQAALRNSEELEPLVAHALTYLAQPPKRTPALEGQLARESGAATSETAEFEQWEEKRLLRHLGALESELASLRYRNALLSEENRRLKLAHVANEATRRDLERDREQLLAEVKQLDANTPKSSNPR